MACAFCKLCVTVRLVAEHQRAYSVHSAAGLRTKAAA
jgi:hypothetical protein